MFGPPAPHNINHVEAIDCANIFKALNRIGENFIGTISGVTGFGVFVTLDEVYVEGLVHISELGNDYYHFDAARHQLTGERSGHRYRLGDRIDVKLARADLETTRLDFVLADKPRVDKQHKA